MLSQLSGVSAASLALGALRAVSCAQLCVFISHSWQEPGVPRAAEMLCSHGRVLLNVSQGRGKFFSCCRLSEGSSGMLLPRFGPATPGLCVPTGCQLCWFVPSLVF